MGTARIHNLPYTTIIPHITLVQSNIILAKFASQSSLLYQQLLSTKDIWLPDLVVLFCFYLKHMVFHLSTPSTVI